MATGQTAGQTAGETIRGKFGSQDVLRQNIVNPMTSSETPLETVDGSTAFPGQLSFPSSRKFLEVFMQPGPSGDLSTVIIGEDLNFDGTTDYSYQLPYPVSGVCGNGIITCTPGTWTACDYYAWTADSSGRVRLQGTTSTGLGGCYCINNDCGSNLVWNNAQVVLGDLGGGIVGAVQSGNPSLTVSDVKTSTTTISYYGQDTSKTTTISGTPSTAAPTPPPQTVYFSTPMDMAQDTNSAVAAQVSDPESTYSLLADLSDASSQRGTRQSCSIQRTVNVFVTNDYCQDPLPATAIQPIVEVKSYSKIDRGIMRNRNDGRCNYTPEGCPPVSTDASPVIDPPQGAVFIGQGSADFWGKKKKNGKDLWSYHVYDYYERCTRSYDNFSMEVVDLCSGYDSNPDCTLESETVDGVKTIRTFNPTGLTPQPSSKDFSGAANHTFTYDWWSKERIYVCKDGTGFDSKTLKKRYGAVVSSVIGAPGSSASYDDMTLDSKGQWVQANGTITLPTLPSHDECEKACKTRKPRHDSQVVPDGHSGQFKTSTDSYDILYHTCIDDRCPTEPGEEILKDCQCLNEFAEAATIMQMLRLAGQDTICSDGVPK